MSGIEKTNLRIDGCCNNQLFTADQRLDALNQWLDSFEYQNDTVMICEILRVISSPPFESCTQRVRTEEMEALQHVVEGMMHLKKGYEESGISSCMAIEAIDACILLIQEHKDNRASSL